MKYDIIDSEGAEPSKEVALVRRGYPKGSIQLDEFAYGYNDNYGNGRQAGEFNVKEIWRKVRKHKWLIVAVTVVITTLTTIHTYRQKPIYQALTMVEVGKEQYAPVKAADLVVTDGDSVGPGGSLKTKIFIILSDPLLESVVRDLQLDKNPNFWRRSSRSMSEAFMTMIGQAPEEEQVPAGKKVVDESAEPPAAGNGPSPEESERLEPYVSKIRGGLKVEQIKETQILSISYTDGDPKIAEAVANGVAKAFIDQNFENKTEKFTRASDWLDRSTRELQAKVEQAEQALANYTRDHNMYSTDGKASLTTDKLTNLHGQALQAQIDRMLKQSLYEQVKSGDLSRLPESYADATLSGLKKQLTDLTIQASQLSLSYGPQNPKLIEMKQQMSSLQSQLDKSITLLGEKLKAEYERAVRNEQSLNDALAQAKAEASQQNQLLIEYSVLRQNADTTKAIYTDFLQRNSQAKIQVAEQNNNVRLIQPAKLPRGPIGTNRNSMIMGAFIVSLLGGIGLALLIEFFDKSIKTVEDVTRYTQLPVLGVVPTVPRLMQVNRSPKTALVRRKEGKLIAREEMSSFTAEKLIALDQNSAAAEAYRGLRTSLLLSTIERPPKTILVVSGRSSEGKTTTAVNTAISLSQLGASVLLIDCDLRKPSAHKLLGVNQHTGLSTYLSQGANLDELIAPTEVENLHLLPCGQIPPNPAELLSSKRMKEMLKTLGEQFDHIVIDSPPITNVTDPIILATMVDGVILVVQAGKSSREDVGRSCQELASVGAKTLGALLNHVDLRRDGKDGYFRYYYSTAEGTEQPEPF